MAQILQFEKTKMNHSHLQSRKSKVVNPKVGPGAAIGAGCVLVLIPVVQTAFEAAIIWPRNPCLPFLATYEAFGSNRYLSRKH